MEYKTLDGYGVNMSNSNLTSVLAAVALSWSLTTAAIAEDPKYSLSVGYDHSSGDYGSTETTDIKFIPITGKIERDAWTLKVSVPWIEIDGPGSLIADGELVAGPDANRSGLGDITASASYLIYPWIENGPFLELTGKIKAPTADDAKGLGTGAVDGTGTLSAFQSFGRFMVFADASYRWRGQPEAYSLQDGYLASIGGSWKFSATESAGLIYSFRESATGSSEDPADIMPYFNIKTSDNWSMNLYGTFGLSDNSPESGVGISVKRSFR